MAMKKLKPEWALDLSKALSKPIRNRIAAIGVELEGAWKKDPTPYRVIRDGSVKDFEYPFCDYRLGELPSEPLSTIKGMDKVAAPWIRKYYPDKVNHTCGLHVHMSFVHLLNYMRVLRSEYPMTVVEEMKKWANANKLPKDHPIWARLEGKSEYCQFVYSGPEQILNRNKDYDKVRTGNRYSVINYNWARTGTVECRLLPMMDTSDLAVNAIQHLVNVTNAFLVVTAQREKALKVEIGDGANSREVREIYVS